MDLNDLVSSIYRLWTFFWPPIVLAIGVLLAIKRWSPDQFLRLSTWFNKSSTTNVQKNLLREIMHKIGAAKVYPVVLLVVGILGIHLVGELIRFSQWFPPGVRYRPEIIARRVLTDREKYILTELIPDSYDLNDAFYNFERQFSTEQAHSTGHDAYFELQMVAKTAAFIIVVVLIYGLWRERDKYRCARGIVGTIILCLGVWVLCLLPVLYDIEQEFYDRSHRIAATLRQEADRRKLPIPDTPGRSIRAAFLNSDQDEWWSVSLDFRLGWDWIKATFAP